MEKLHYHLTKVKEPNTRTVGLVVLTAACAWKFGRTRKTFYDISSGEPGMLRRGSRRSVDPPYERATAARNLPNVPLVGAQAGFSPMSNMSGYVHVHPTRSPVIGTPVSGSPASSAQPMGTPPGLGSPVPPVPQQQQQPSLENQLLVQTVQQQQQQITQMMTLVETLVSRQQPVHGPENRSQAAAGALSDISSIHSVEVDEGGAPIETRRPRTTFQKCRFLMARRCRKAEALR